MNESRKREYQTRYNQIAGQSLERLAAISDGIFAVAMTLLVLDLRDPAREVIHSEQDLGNALLAMFPQFITYLMSFLTLAIFWNGQQAQLNNFTQANRHLTWIHMAFLFAVSVMPFSTRLLAEFINYRTALLCYWTNIVLLGGALYLSWLYASRAKLVKDDTPENVRKAVERRILGAQAPLCVWGGVMHPEHLCEHRVHRSGATPLRGRAPDSVALANLVYRVDIGYKSSQ
jgi:uncharacterized membrane protein